MRLPDPEIGPLHRLRLRLATAILPRTHRAVQVEDVMTAPRQVASDLIRGGDALARGWGCHPAVLYNGAALIRAAKLEPHPRPAWKCPIGNSGCTKNCGDYGCGN